MGPGFPGPRRRFLARRAAAYRTFYEFMPLKPVFSQPHGPNMRLYDRYDFGDLMRVDIIDGRQYRSREACYGDPAKKEGHGGGGHLETAAACPELMDASRSMIGMAQEKWLFEGLATSKARWNVIANDVLMARLHQKTPTGERRILDRRLGRLSGQPHAADAAHRRRQALQSGASSPATSIPSGPTI